jgi:hypothetical protein
LKDGYLIKTIFKLVMNPVSSADAWRWIKGKKSGGKQDLSLWMRKLEFRTSISWPLQA